MKKKKKKKKNGPKIKMKESLSFQKTNKNAHKKPDSGRGGSRLQGRERLVTADGGLITAPEKLVTADGELITGAGVLITAAREAYDSGRRADYRGGRGF